MLSPKESFAPIIDITQMEVILAVFGFFAALFSWALFRIKLPKNIGRAVKRKRAINVNKFFLPILVITPILFLFGMDAMAWTGLIMLMSAGGIKIPYWMPRIGKFSMAADSYSNEIAEQKSDIGFDCAGEIKGLVNPWFSLSRSKRREKIKLKNHQRETIELIQESIFSAKFKVVLELFKTYILFSIIFSVLYNTLPTLLPESVSSTLFSGQTYSFYEILFINYFAYGVIPLFLYLSYRSSASAIELLKIAAINSPKYVNIEGKPKTMKERFLSRKNHTSGNMRSNNDNRRRQNPLTNPNVLLGSHPRVMHQSPPVMQPPPPVMQPPPPVMQPPPPPVMQPPPPVMQPPPPVMPPPPPVMQPPPPPMPSSGLPPGWTTEQWKHYGKQWIEQNNFNN